MKNNTIQAPQNMVIAKSRFADPTVDFAFKRVFGTEKYKAATIGLLNSIIKGRHIVDVSFLNSELIGDTGDSRKAYIDVLCEDESGAQFVVEMQKARQEHFRERTVFYASKLISMMSPQGKSWNYSLAPTYVVAFLNFEMKGMVGGEGEAGSDDDRYLLHYVTRDEQSQTKLPGSTEYYFLGIRDFNKKDRSYADSPEKWLSLLGKTGLLEDIPSEYEGDEAFAAYFKACERAGFNKEEEQLYTTDMMNEWDIANEKALERKEGKAEGLAEGLEKGLKKGLKEGWKKGNEEGLEKGLEKGKSEAKLETARSLKSLGVDIDIICKSTGLARDVVESL